MAIFPFKKEEREDISEKSEKKEVITPPEKETETEKEKEAKIEGGGEILTTAPPPAVTLPTPVEEVLLPPKREKSPILIEIEQILSENLDEIYNSLTAEQKLIFRKKGEETASKIEILLREIKINIKKIMILIRDWLLMLVKMIPGINKLFLIQEAKIKTDKILLLAEKRKKWDNS
ncbi:MAG: hypothetical protein N2259_00380 [Patescibacteria group bacterium]|nr:hypothetical protein [Patescibacteria group bacterium]